MNDYIAYLVSDSMDAAYGCIPKANFSWCPTWAKFYR